MYKTLLTLLALFLCVFSTVSQAQVNDKKLMTDADYKTFLLRVDATLPKWETALKNIDLEKVPQISYPRGKSITDQRDLGLMEISNIRTYVSMQQHKRTVYGELALSGFIESLFDTGQEIVWEEDLNGLTLTAIDKFAPELSTLIIGIKNDAMERVALLEKSSCPSSI